VVDGARETPELHRQLDTAGANARGNRTRATVIVAIAVVGCHELIAA
jgi:hypothetical protein